jgi:hypothetical protein
VMLRIQNLFAVASLLFLSLGLLASRIASTGFTFQIGQRRGFGLSLEVPFYCIAALFGAFAFLYSIGYIPFNPMMARWHFGSVLSESSYVLPAQPSSGSEQSTRKSRGHGA